MHGLGVKTFAESAAKKFKTVSGYYIVAGMVALMYGDVVVCALNRGEKVLQFLELLLKEGHDFLSKLPIARSASVRVGRRQKVPERSPA